MANPLTGDFEAVLQVSAATVNRLLAGMHQNAFARPGLPSFPHWTRLRIGDDRPIDHVRGLLAAQLGAPRIELLHGATDRFVLEVDVRAHYRSDAGYAPLADFIHGTVRAEYRITDIDPSCPGWRTAAADHLWLRVVRDSVRFTGTARDEVDSFDLGVIVAGEAAEPDLGRITRQIAGLLATRFEPAPHPVSPRFRRGSMRSLSSPAGSAVALPLALGGEPAGDVASIDTLLLDGADFAVAIRREAVLGLAQPALDAIAGFRPTVHVHVSTPWPAPDIDTVYRVHVDPPTVAWEAHGSFALIRIHAHGGAHTDSVLPDATFDVDQDVVLSFDAGAERLWLSPGSRTVTTHSSGLGSGTVADAVNGAVGGAVKTTVEAVCAQAQPALDGMIARKQELIGQLRTFDDQAGAWFAGAAFAPDGMVLRGTIVLAPRQHPQVAFEPAAARDGFTALASWVPGGRIDRFRWSWSWFNGAGPDGAATRDDRFVLRRPWGGSRGRFGVALGVHDPLPGIDGMGRVCLILDGVQTDAATGALVPVSTSRACHRYGYDLRVDVRGLRPLVHDLGAQAPAIVDLGPPGGDPAPGRPNTLVAHVEERWRDETAAMLREGVARCRRADAGLVVVLLLRAGMLPAGGSDLEAQVRELRGRLEAPLVVAEDVGGAWATALSLHAEPGEPTWALVSPTGGLVWRHHGPAEGDRLAAALDAHLYTSAMVTPQRVRPRFDVGARVTPGLLDPWAGAELERWCPPPPLDRGIRPSVVAFVHREDLEGSRELLARAARAHPEAALVAVVTGAQDAEDLDGRLGDGVLAVPDHDGALAARLGVRVWPTTALLDARGVVNAVDPVLTPREEAQR